MSTNLIGFYYVDLFDDHEASHMNKLMATSLYAEYCNVETLSADLALFDIDCQFQLLTASGSTRVVKLSPEAITNHVTIIQNAGSTQNIQVKDDAGAIVFATLLPGEWAMFLPFGGTSWKMATYLRETEYKITPTVASNDLIVTLTHADGTTPSASRPLWVKIGSTWRPIVASTSITIADGVNWFNAGSVELGTQLVGYFPYLVWDSNSSVVALTLARIPYARLVSDFSATTTNEKHCFNYANFTTTDEVVNIGYFEATLSLAGTSHLWTVPTFTNANLIQTPIDSTRLLTLTVSTAAGNLTAGAGAPTTVSDTAVYRVRGRQVFIKHNVIVTDKGTASGFLKVAHPFTLTAIESMAGNEYQAVGYAIVGIAATTTTMNLWKYDLTTLWQSTHRFIASGWFELP
jgi:hypothetical protein